MRRFTPSHRGGRGTPLVCLHGFLDTWRTWSLVLPALEREHDVLALTLPGHAGGPSPAGPATTDTVLDMIEAALDDAGLPTAHLVGNSLGGYLALALAERGRGRSVVALAPAGGWAPDDHTFRDTLDLQDALYANVQGSAPQAEHIAATPDGRRRATALLAEHGERLPADLVADLIRGVAGCTAAREMLAGARDFDWPLDASRIACPIEIVWGTADRLLPWPSAAVRYRRLLPHADWVELDDVGHCPQLDAPLTTAQLVLGFTA